MWCVLVVVRNSHPDKYESIAIQAATHPNPQGAVAAANLATSGQNPETIAAQDARILENVAIHPDMWVRRSSLFPIGRLGRDPVYTKRAIKLLLVVEVGEDEKAADDMFRAFAPQAIPMSSLSEDDVVGFLGKLIPVSEVDEYWIEQFLSWAAQDYPERVFEFVIARIEHDAFLRKNKTGRSHYHPVPYSDLHSTFSGIQQTPHYVHMLRAVRDRLIDDEVMQRFWLRNLFWSVAGIDDTALLCIDEWLHSGDVVKVKAALYLVGEGPENFAFARPFFAVHAIACASDVSIELANSAFAAFTGNVFKGGMNSNPGDPPPRLLSTKQQAERLRNQFSYWDWGAKLFDGIVKHADEMIEGFRIDDEEFRFNN